MSHFNYTKQNFNPNFNSTNPNDIFALKQAQSYQELLDDNIELRKSISQLNILITKQCKEKGTLKNIHEEFKLIHDRTRKELQESNTHIYNITNENKQLEKKVANELIKHDILYKEAQESYEKKLFMIRKTEDENLKNKIGTELELKFSNEIKSKNDEVELIEEKYNIKNNEFEILLTEYETYKLNIEQEIDKYQYNHKLEIKELLHKINNLTNLTNESYDRDTYKALKSKHDILVKANNEILLENSNIKREVNSASHDKNEARLLLMREVEAERLKSRIYSSENEKNMHVVSSLELELTTCRQRLEEKADENKLILEEKFIYAKELHDKENEFNSFKSEMVLLRNRLEERDLEMNNMMKVSSEQENQRILKDNADKEHLIIENEALNSLNIELKNEYSNFYTHANKEISSCKRDFYIVTEEKKNLQTKIVELQQQIEMTSNEFTKNIYESKVMNVERNKLEEKIRDLTLKEADSQRNKVELEHILEIKVDELEKTRKSLVASDIIVDKKIQEMFSKKEYYKSKVSNWLYVYLLYVCIFNYCLLCVCMFVYLYSVKLSILK